MVSRSPNDPDFDPSKVLLEELSSRISKRQFDTWFKGADLNCVPPNRVVISLPSRFHKNWFELKYKETIRHSARTVFNEEPQIEFELPVSADLTTDPSRVSSDSSATSFPDESFCSPTRKEFSFENFVVGPSNRIAYAAALAVSEIHNDHDDSPSYNPLVIYSDSGLGKTHLLHACTLRIRHLDSRRPLYLTCEDFTNRTLAAMKTNTHWSLFRKFRSFDALIVDGIQFLTEKGRIQDEFYHLFNEFHSNGKQIVLSCDCPPKQIPGLTERLVSRFKTGLIAKLDEPILETRITILKKKSALLGAELPTDIAEALARELGPNPRELEGALLRLLSQSASKRGGTNPFSDFAPIIFTNKDVLSESRSISISDIQATICSYYKLKLSDLNSSSRERALVFPRQIGMYLARSLTHHSLGEIGGFFGGRDHATVVYAVRKIRERIEIDSSVGAEVEEIKKRLLEGP